MWHYFPGMYMPSYQVNRALTQAHYGGGEFAEILEVASNIDPKDRSTINKAWLDMGNPVFDLAEEFENNGNFVSARRTYLRAFNYLRSAEFFMKLGDDQKLETYKKAREAFERAIKYFDEAKTQLDKFKNENITVTVKRGNEIKEIAVEVTNDGKLGVGLGQLSFKDLEKLEYYKLASFEYSFAQAIPAGWNKSWKTLTDYVKQLKKIFNPSTGAYKGLGGFISIGSIFPAEWSAESFWTITAFLSIMLGFMNLLPIPALDGGHVVFTLWEMITGKKPGDKFLEYAQVVGFILLIALLIFANGNDIFRLFK